MRVKLFLLFLTTGLSAFFAPYAHAANVSISVTGNETSESRVSVQSNVRSESRTYRLGNNSLTIQTNTNDASSIDWNTRARESFTTLANEINQEDAQINSWIRAWLERHNFARKTFWTFMRGSEEVPGPGDTDGYGVTRVKVNTDNNDVCVRIRVFDIQTATAAHIHKAKVGEAGPVVVTLPTPDSEGKARGCAVVDDAVANDLANNPSNYYVNIHNQEFPNGAVRGQLR